VETTPETERPATALEVTTGIEDGVAVIVLRGSLDAEHADQLGHALADRLALGDRNFVVDMTDVGVLDGVGLASLVEMFKRVRIGPGDVRLCGLQAWVKVMFAMTRLNRVFDTFETREAAVASFAPAENA
jgi:anti-sigma B factor antagonist